MQTNRKILAAAAITCVVGLTVYTKGSQIATLDRPVFADLDKRTLKKAYNRLFFRVLTGRQSIDNMTEAQLDELLKFEYMLLDK